MIARKSEHWIGSTCKYVEKKQTNCLQRNNKFFTYIIMKEEIVIAMKFIREIRRVIFRRILSFSNI